MSENRFETPEADLGDVQTTDMKYAGFWIRAAASIIDTIWQMVLIFGLIWLFFRDSLLSEDPFAGGVGMMIVQYILPAIIIIGFWAYYSATPGKMLLGLKICRASDGGKPSTGQFIGRYFGYFLSAIALFLGFIWVGFDKRKQGWHDKLSKTVVLKTR